MSATPGPADPRLDSRLADMWRQHVSDDAALFDRVLTRHREKHRRYHDVTHVSWVVAVVDDLATVEPTVDLGATVAAAFYHDAVYEPASPANERASARLARRDLAALGWGDARIEHVAAMIEATREHRAPPDADHAVLFDADLSILGSPPGGYRRYVDAVRAEYHHVDDASWATGRSQILGAFLEREAIYATTTGRSRWEAAARSNIAGELASLHP